MDNKVIERYLTEMRDIGYKNALIDVILKLQETYGQDGQPALIVMEEHEEGGGTTQKPALDELIKLIESLKI